MVALAQFRHTGETGGFYGLMSTETIRGTVEVSDPFVGIHDAVLAGVDVQSSSVPSQRSATEAERFVARCIRVRQLLLPTFRNTYGPADLCVVYKRWRTALSGKQAEAESGKTPASPVANQRGQLDGPVMEVVAGDLKTRSSTLTAWFHFVRGIWHRTPADAASYLGALVMHGLESAAWYATGSYRIERAACLAYNCFTNEDVVIEAHFPGCVRVRRLTGPRPFDAQRPDEHATTSEATFEAASMDLDDIQWAQLSISAVLRSVEAVGEKPLYPALKEMASLCADWSGEVAFLEAARETLSCWKAAGSRYTDLSGTTAASSIVAEGIWNYFSRYARYQKALSFFQELVEQHGERALMLYVARALMAQERYEQAQTLLTETLHTSTEATPLPVVDTLRLSLALAECESVNGQLTEAMDRLLHGLTKCLRSRLKQDDQQDGTNNGVDSELVSTSGEMGRLICFALARLYAQTGEYESALRALNMAEVEPPQMDWFLRQVTTVQDSMENAEGKSPRQRQVTQPRSGKASGTDAIRVLARRLAEERIGAGAFGEGRERHHADRILGDLTGSVLTPAEREAYDILVKIVNQVGWDELLHIRSRVFIMESDVLPSVVNAGEPAVSSDTAMAPSGPTENELQVERHLVSDPATVRIRDAPAVSPSPGLGDAVANTAHVPSADPDTHNIESSAEPKMANTAHVPSADPDTHDIESSAEPRMALTLADTRRQVNPSALNKALCTAWLDTLIHCLYEDLRAWSIWQHEERTLFESRNSTETSDAERIEVAAPTPLVPLTVVIAETRRAAVDWLRRGELAERLEYPEMAERAYRICLGVAERSQTAALTAWMRLAALQTEHGEAHEVIDALDQVWQYVCEHTDDTAPTKPMPDMLQTLLYRAVARFGLRAVRAAVSGLRHHQERLRSLLLDAVAAQVYGHDR